MRALITTIWIACLLCTRAGAQFLSGFGQTPYEPLCCETCRRSLSSLALDCTVMDHGNTDSHMSSTTPECYAKNDPFLTSLAWCMSIKCAPYGIKTSKIDQYWETRATGSESVGAKWSYSKALLAVNPRPPANQLNDTDMYLNVTSAVSENVYLAQWNVLGNIQYTAIRESAYGIAIFASAVGIPVLLTWIRYLPYMASLKDKLKPYILYPSTVGTYQVRSLPYLLGNPPTIGQGVYIAIIAILNIVFCCVGYRAAQPNAWFASQWNEISAYVMYRTGAFAFMLSPLLLLFSSRNNPLLWLTDWTHSTFMLLHRWIARLFMLHVVIHSIIGLQIYARNAQTSWWIWGVVATIATVILTFASGLHVRKDHYELFLATHIVLAVLILVGSWYHIIQWYASMGMYIPDTSGYEVWLYIAFCVWFFDRFVRVGRIIKAGPRRSTVTDLGEGHVRIDVPNIRWGQELGRHVYVYFPTLRPLRPWENHPFSIIPTELLHQSDRSLSTNSVADSPEKHGQVVGQTGLETAKNTKIGITLFVKKHAGITKYLDAHDSLLTFLEGPYPNCRPAEVLRCDRILLIAGGVGITGLLPWAYSHWNVKLAWSVKPSAQCLVDAIDLSRVEDKEVRVGDRFQIFELIDREVDAGWTRIGVVVSGPASLCDDVRALVAQTARNGQAVFQLEVDAYSW